MGDSYIIRRGGGKFDKSQIIVSAPSGSKISITNGIKIKKTLEKNGQWIFTGLDNGKWTVNAQRNNETSTSIVDINKFQIYYVVIQYTIPVSSVAYSGTKSLNQSGNNWQYRLLSNGILRFSTSGYIDIFGIGGGGSGGSYESNGYGGGGGGSGYSATKRSVYVEANTDYVVVIGNGRKSDNYGNNGDGEPSYIKKGDTYIINVAGGKAGKFGYRASVGPGGGAGGAGGAPGGKGSDYGIAGNKGADGVHEFGESDKPRIGGGGGGGGFNSSGGAGGAGGGGAGSQGNATPGAVNTGSGGGGSGNKVNWGHASGGSGVIIIRNRR